MDEATQPMPEQFRLTLENGETIELDGSVLHLDRDEASPSVVLRVTPGGRSLAYVLEEWSTVARLFARENRRSIDELELSRVLAGAAAAPEGSELPVREPRGKTGGAVGAAVGGAPGVDRTGAAVVGGGCGGVVAIG